MSLDCSTSAFSVGSHEKPEALERISRNRPFQEVFAGAAGLSRHFKNLGWSVGDPVELSPDSGSGRLGSDLLDPRVVSRLMASVCSTWAYWHFGLPCSSFSRLNVNANRGSRTHQRAEGDGTLHREILGNRLLAASVSLILMLDARGSWWSLENPAGSLVWQMPSIKRLCRKPGVHKVRFC